MYIWVKQTLLHQTRICQLTMSNPQHEKQGQSNHLKHPQINLHVLEVQKHHITKDSKAIRANTRYIKLTKKRLRKLFQESSLGFNFTINWSVLATALAYSNKSKWCHLCLTEKLYLIRAQKPSLLNKRTELILNVATKINFT